MNPKYKALSNTLAKMPEDSIFDKQGIIVLLGAFLAENPDFDIDEFIENCKYPICLKPEQRM